MIQISNGIRATVVLLWHSQELRANPEMQKKKKKKHEIFNNLLQFKNKKSQQDTL